VKCNTNPQLLGSLDERSQIANEGQWAFGYIYVTGYVFAGHWKCHRNGGQLLISYRHYRNPYRSDTQTVPTINRIQNPFFCYSISVSSLFSLVLQLFAFSVFGSRGCSDTFELSRTEIERGVQNVLPNRQSGGQAQLCAPPEPPQQISVHT
jgi:hypothetical protein